jgi:alkanesulfonate monooxygenase SsuD/methylene tetrahydromethanopterin reductase-like flavin-dependent oxidoreductase (luciferase family)
MAKLEDYGLRPDPVIEAYKKDVDRTLLRENLKLTVEERLERGEEHLRIVEKLRAAGREVDGSYWKDRDALAELKASREEEGP